MSKRAKILIFTVLLLAVFAGSYVVQGYIFDNNEEEYSGDDLVLGGTNNWVATDNFESYTQGTDLHAKNGGTGWASAWEADAIFDISAVAASGLNAVELVHDGDSAKRAYRTFSSITNGTAYWRFKGENIGDSHYIHFRDGGAGDAVSFDFRMSGGFFQMKNNATWTNINKAYVNTWYDLKLDWSCDTDSFTLSVATTTDASWDNAVVSPSYTAVDGACAAVTKLQIEPTDGQSGFTSYWDDITGTDYYGTGETNSCTPTAGQEWQVSYNDYCHITSDTLHNAGLVCSGVGDFVVDGAILRVASSTCSDISVKDDGKFIIMPSP